MSRILGIETSCDETGVAVVADGRRVLINEVASQVDLHRAFGGVVPEIASREHTRVISQLVRRALHAASGGIDAIAATHGPGLMGSLLVGVCFGKALAYARKMPFVPVHHIEGHIFSAFLSDPAPQFPFLALVVSGGHTQIIDCPRPHAYRILGTTRDDAVGECFDKVARLLGLPYPGGPSIQKAAENGNSETVVFPRAMRDAEHLDFSYSGLKTAVLYELRGGKGHSVADLAASFQDAAVDILLIKTKQALQITGATQLVLAGGVAANRLLRHRLQAELDARVFLPPFEYCIDNGAMIAAAGASRLEHGLAGDLRTTPSPNLRLCGRD
ncbi:MAG: tRNA (adenosine(37)-N6)-threonylcarbamoyltransferase complex transferase subunit TsaD [Candidatus Hydrogenedentes bacterium]|nr:tRNA (adenosine(37)-N6)-threonylcarbamoyltransferase complex transferase subunit TsaD [Candidatus Hydrogenedentota bacterium]